MGHSWQAAGSRGCREALWGEARASLCRTQMVPSGSNPPTTGHIWCGDTSGKMYSRKGLKHLTEEGWNKKCKKQPCRHQGQRRKRIRRHLQPVGKSMVEYISIHMEHPTLEELDTPERLWTMESPSYSGESLRMKWQRGAVTDREELVICQLGWDRK